MRRNIKTFRVSAVFGLAAMTLSLSPTVAGSQTGTVPHCSAAPGRIKEEQIVKVLSENEPDMIHHKVVIYEEPCDGGLYLIDFERRDKWFKINESWWLYAFESAVWQDTDRENEIAVTARYATGIGPTGAVPFRAKIIMQRRSNEWVPLEPVFLKE